MAIGGHQRRLRSGGNRQRQVRQQRPAGMVGNADAFPADFASEAGKRQGAGNLSHAGRTIQIGKNLLRGFVRLANRLDRVPQADDRHRQASQRQREHPQPRRDGAGGKPDHQQQQGGAHPQQPQQPRSQGHARRQTVARVAPVAIEGRCKRLVVGGCSGHAFDDPGGAKCIQHGLLPRGQLGLGIPVGGVRSGLQPLIQSPHEQHQ